MGRKPEITKEHKHDSARAQVKSRTRSKALAGPGVKPRNADSRPKILVLEVVPGPF